MTKDEFISYTKGIISSELERVRIEKLKAKIVGDFELTGPLRLIKDALDNINPEFIPESRFSINNPNMIPYSEICSCNPKNGGSGLCGCTLGNTLVPKCACGPITTTNSNPISNSPTNEKI